MGEIVPYEGGLNTILRFQTSPQFLASNATSHTWAFSAVAELIGKIMAICCAFYG